MDQKQTAWPPGSTKASVLVYAYERYHFDSHGTFLTRPSWRTPPSFSDVLGKKRVCVAQLDLWNAETSHLCGPIRSFFLRQATGSPGLFLLTWQSFLFLDKGKARSVGCASSERRNLGCDETWRLPIALCAPSRRKRTGVLRCGRQDSRGVRLTSTPEAT